MKKRLTVFLASVLTVSLLGAGFAGCGKGKAQESELTTVTLNEVAHSIFTLPSMWRLRKGILRRRALICSL